MSENEKTISVNGERCATGASDLEALLRERGQDPGRPGIAVAINDDVVRRADWKGTTLREGDRVEIVGAVQGG